MSSLPQAQPLERRRPPRFTDRQALAPGLSVSPICLGLCGGPEVVLAAYDAGINFFFLSADMHWPRYEATRRGLELLFARGAAIRDQVVVGVVSYVAQPEFAWVPLEEVVQAVRGLERVDLSIMGGARGQDYLVRLAALESHRATSFLGVRAVGSSFHERMSALLAVRHALVDVAFVRYNPAHPKGAQDLFPHLSRPRQTLVYNFKSTFGYGSPEQLDALGLDPEHWRPDITDYYRFALSQPALDGLLVGLAEVGHVAELAAALERGPLSPEEDLYLRRLAQLLRGQAMLRRG